MKIQSNPSPLALCIREQLDRYLENLGDQHPNNLHRLVVAEAERAVIHYTMEMCESNQSLAAEMLGISRGTLRTKLALYDL